MSFKVVAAVCVAFAGYLISILLRHSSENDVKNTDLQNPGLNKLVSSVWCYEKTKTKLCTFKNICYIPHAGHFIFILRNESIISGLNSKDDLKTLSYSSIINHNRLYMRIEMLLNNTEHLDSAVFVNEPMLLISRFKPDNIMHVIHDDILPIFMTYDSFCFGDTLLCAQNIRIMFTDLTNSNHYEEWYGILSNKKPYYVEKLNMPTCFDKVLVGLSRETLWFQYGFGVPQGPILVYPSGINSVVIKKFKDYALSSLKVDAMPKIEPGMLNIAFFVRKFNRRIINEDFVTEEIMKVAVEMYPEYTNRIRIHPLDASTNMSVYILSVVIHCKILVGIHGGAMIYSLFLPENAAIVEVFPFGIQPEYVSGTRALTQLPGIFYNYLSWTNVKEANTIVHPYKPRLLGGIMHLSESLRNEIQQLKRVPPVHCCHNPAYLYRMYQDTKVDNSFSLYLKQVLINQRSESRINANRSPLNTYLKSSWFYPGYVINVDCIVDEPHGVVFISWNKSLNTYYIKGHSLSYDLSVKVCSRVVKLETFSIRISLKIHDEETNAYTKNTSQIQVWISSTLHNERSGEVHSYCRPNR